MMLGVYFAAQKVDLGAEQAAVLVLDQHVECGDGAGEDRQIFFGGQESDHLQRSRSFVDDDRVVVLYQICGCAADPLFLLGTQDFPAHMGRLRAIQVQLDRSTVYTLQLFLRFELFQIPANGLRRNLQLFYQIVGSYLTVCVYQLQNDLLTLFSEQRHASCPPMIVLPAL